MTTHIIYTYGTYRRNNNCIIDDKKVTVGVFIHLKKAFDTINHNLLLKKLAHYGVRGVANKWLASYLSNRKPYVVCLKVLY